MAKTPEQSEENTQDAAQPKGMVGGAWDGIRKFAAGGFFKGLLITAALVVGVMAVVAGTMGTGVIGGLAVGGIPVLTFEAGFAEGMSKGLEFLTSSALGWATLAAGGLLGSYWSVRKNQAKEQSAAENDRHAKLLELTQGVDQQKSQQQSMEQQQPAPVPAQQTQQTQVQAEQLTQQNPQPQVIHHHHYHDRESRHHSEHTLREHIMHEREIEKTHIHHTDSNTQNTQVFSAEHTPGLQAHGREKECPDSIYLANSTIKGQGFSASELKRRVERAVNNECKTV